MRFNAFSVSTTDFNQRSGGCLGSYVLDFVIGTAVLWVLTYGVAVPLARVFAGTSESSLRLRPVPSSQQDLTKPSAIGNQAKKPDAVDSVSTEAFVLAHVLVLGVAGLLLGAIAGVYFIGFSLKGKMWPGMIALIVASLIGASAMH